MWSLPWACDDTQNWKFGLGRHRVKQCKTAVLKEGPKSHLSIQQRKSASRRCVYQGPSFTRHVRVRRVLPWGVIFLFLFAAMPFLLVNGAEHQYNFVIDALTSNTHSPDCQDLTAVWKYLFLVSDVSNQSNHVDQYDPLSLPGPTIEADEGDTITVTVTNNNPFMGTSIHWHGMHQVGTPYMDGTAGITQCELGPLATQKFQFVAYPPGTHFWHGHFGMDMADGIAGPLIIHPKDPEPYSYDAEYTIFLQDFYVQTAEQQQIGLSTYPFTWIGDPDSILINGRGIAPACAQEKKMIRKTKKDKRQKRQSNAAACMDSCASDPLKQLSKFVVEPGKTYRLRIINACQLEMLNVAIADHVLTLVEIEGTNVIPVPSQNFDLGAGQRYSFLFTAKQTPGSYWLETSISQRNTPSLVGRAIVQYSNANESIPDKEPHHPNWDSSKGSKEWIFGRTKDVSKYPESVALNATEIKRYVLVPTQAHHIGRNGQVKQLRWAVNNISFIPSYSEPLIGEAVWTARVLGWPREIPGTIDMPENPPTIWNYTLPVESPDVPGPNLGKQGVSVMRLNRGEVVEVVLQNTEDLSDVSDVHQWHMHGHSFWVVGEGSGVYNAKQDVPKYNLFNPVLRDTVQQWPSGWTAIRFVANNPGVWIFHCHILPHLIMGMAVALVVQPDEIEGELSESVRDCMKNSLYPEPEESTSS